MKFLLFNLVNKDKETEEWIQNFSALCLYIFWILYLLIQGKLNDILFSKPFYVCKFGFIPIFFRTNTIQSINFLLLTNIIMITILGILAFMTRYH